jgi:maleylacetate reductase
VHVPIESAREACEKARRLGADCAVAIGGGLTTGPGNAITLLDIVSAPTLDDGAPLSPTEIGMRVDGLDCATLPARAAGLRCCPTESLNHRGHPAVGAGCRTGP